MNQEIHICAECIHYVPDESNHVFDKCTGGSDQPINYVTGEKMPVYCSAQRFGPQCPDFEKLEVNYG
jgi:hypothetical protein